MSMLTGGVFVEQSAIRRTAHPVMRLIAIARFVGGRRSNGAAVGRARVNRGPANSNLIAELEIDRGLAALHPDIFARDLVQNDPHIAWRNAEWLEVPNDRLVERAFGRE